MFIRDAPFGTHMTLLWTLTLPGVYFILPNCVKIQRAQNECGSDCAVEKTHQVRVFVLAVIQDIKHLYAADSKCTSTMNQRFQTTEWKYSLTSEIIE